MTQYRFEIEIKDDDLLDTLESHEIVIEAESDEEALTKFEWVARERGWDTHMAEEMVDGDWIPANYPKRDTTYSIPDFSEGHSYGEA